jgi:hypothetical protein
MTNDPTTARDSAVKRLIARRDWWTHLVVYLVFNGAIVLVWFITGQGYFWPGWLIGLWGAGLLIHGWDVWFRRPITEQEIRREMARQTGSKA